MKWKVFKGTAKSRFQKQKDPKGQTVLFIATAIGMLILLVASGVLTLIVPTYRSATGDLRSTEAEYLALELIERGQYAIYQNGPGYEESGEITGQGDGRSATYDVIGRSATKFGVDQYAIPEPETGDAGVGCEGYVFDDGDWEDDLDNPCNWNKLEFGDTGVIPLYIDDGVEVLNPRDSIGPGKYRFDELLLKVRTPCMEGTEDEYGGCERSNRYELDCGDFGECSLQDIRIDDTIVNWEIKGLCNGGSESCYILANDKLSGQYLRHEFENSEITENDINTKSDYLVLLIKSFITKGRTKDNPSQDIHSFVIDNDFTNPVLQFSIINRLESKNGESVTVPYLEYQIVYKASESLPNSIRYVEAEGNSQGYIKRLSVGVGQESSVSGFVIQN